MAEWVLASTADYWIESSTCTYLGDDEWLITAEGGTYGSLSIRVDNPLITAGDSIYGIRFNITGGSATYWVTFNTYGQVPVAAESPFEYVLDLADRTAGEYVSLFDPGLYDLGYGASALISGIELYVEANTNNTNSCCTLYKTTGITVVTIPDNPGSTPVRPVPTTPISNGTIPFPGGAGSPSYGSGTVSTPSPGGSSPGGGDSECRICRLVPSTSPNTGIQIPPGCCRVIIIFNQDEDVSI